MTECTYVDDWAGPCIRALELHGPTGPHHFDANWDGRLERDFPVAAAALARAKLEGIV